MASKAKPRTRKRRNEVNYNTVTNTPNIAKLVVLGVAGLFGLTLLLGSFTIIPSGSRGVATHFGKVQDGILDEGIHLKLPIITSIHKLSVRVQKSEAVAEAASHDMQRVKATFVLNWHVSATSVNKMFQEIGAEEAVTERVIQPAVQEVLKAATAKRTAEEILTKRLELKDEIDAMLMKRLAQYHVLINDVSLTNLDFTEQFNHAVEEKQIAEQAAKKAEYEAQRATQEAIAVVNRAKGDAESKITMARAEAESQRLVKQTITAEILQQRAIEKWDGVLPQIMAGKGALPFINITPQTKKTKTQVAEEASEE